MVEPDKPSGPPTRKKCHCEPEAKQSPVPSLETASAYGLAVT
jgi:hypothetical protein